MLSQRFADKTDENLSETKAERLHEAAMGLGHGGSMLKVLNLLKSTLKLKADSVLLVHNGTQLHSAADKLERLREHFAQVTNVAVEVDERVLS